MQRILVAGAGKIGTLIAYLLADSGDYEVYLADISIQHLTADFPRPNIQLVELDAINAAQLGGFFQQYSITAVVSSLPYFCNLAVAEVAKEHAVHYFDLTEDVDVTAKIKELAAEGKNIFVPQCGLAPGFINIAAQHLIQGFDSLDTVKMRVGNLPITSSHALRYALSWSTDGLINEYGNTCYGIVEGQKVALQPLHDLETVEIDGVFYEAFNTSGGVGSLVDLYVGKVNNLDYRTLRYPGHCEKMRFLMQDLRLNDDRETLKGILENVLPQNKNDVTVIYAAVTGVKNGQYIEESYMNKIYPKELLGRSWSAIQVATSGGLCAVLDIVLHNLDQYHGLVLQEQFSLTDIVNNRFGKVYAII